MNSELGTEGRTMTKAQINRRAATLRKQAAEFEAAGLTGLARAYRDLADAVAAEALGRD